MNEKTTKYLTNQINFGTIYNAIENKEIKSNDYIGLRIDSGKRFFNDFLKGIESLTKTEEPYFLVENIEEIADAFGYKKINNENISKIISSVKKTLSNLDELEKDPAEFFKTKEAKELSEVCKNLVTFYDFLSKEKSLADIKDDD